MNFYDYPVILVKSPWLIENYLLFLTAIRLIMLSRSKKFWIIVIGKNNKTKITYPGILPLISSFLKNLYLYESKFWIEIAQWADRLDLKNFEL